MDSIAGANANDVDIVERALANDDFRQVLMTGERLQVALMTLPVGEEIGVRTQEDVDQLIYLVEGYAEVTVQTRTNTADAGHLIFVPAGVEHNVSNTGEDPLRLVTAQSPPRHEPGRVHRTRGEAEAIETSG